MADTSQEIKDTLFNLRAKAAQINASLSSRELSPEARNNAKREYMQVAADIAGLKVKQNALRAANISASKKKEGATRLFCLLFPADKRTQYFATDMPVLELILALNDVFGESAPAITSLCVVPEDQLSKIPEAWFELVPAEISDVPA